MDVEAEALAEVLALTGGLEYVLAGGVLAVGAGALAAALAVAVAVGSAMGVVLAAAVTEAPGTVTIDVLPTQSKVVAVTFVSAVSDGHGGVVRTRLGPCGGDSLGNPARGSVAQRSF